jgi:hypothetical protein
MFSGFGARPINLAGPTNAAPGSKPKPTPAIADNFKNVRLFVVMSLSDTEALIKLVRYRQHFYFLSSSRAGGGNAKRAALPHGLKTNRSIESSRNVP